MRIAVSSTACNGKSYFIKSFLNRWPRYKTPETTYRDLIEEKGLTLNKEATVDSQRIIRDAITDQAIQNADEEFCIHDRCVLDNLVYTLWLAEKGLIDDDDFIGESFHITRETLKMYDIIFFLPLTPLSPVVLEEKETRELDKDYRKEIDALFLSVQHSYKQREGLIFPVENCPAMIEIFGDEKNREKTEMVSLYLEESGSFKTTDENLVKDITETAQEDALAAALLNQVKDTDEHGKIDKGIILP